MDRTFSPRRCVPWWVYLICAGLFVGTFIIGRLLGAQPVVEVLAEANGKRVKAEVWQGNAKIGETPEENAKTGYLLKGHRGTKLEYTVRYAGYDKSESAEPTRRHTVAITDFSTVTITFHAYDTAGRELKDDLGINTYVYVQEDGAKWEQMPAPKTELKGTTRTVQFKCDDSKGDGKYKAQGVLTAEVTWLGQEPHIKWLSADLPQSLAGLDPKYDAKQWQSVVERRLSPQTKETTYDYPCLFMAHERVGAGPGREKPPSPPSTSEGPDDPIPYKTIQERHLTDQDVAGFDDLKLRTLVNNIFARNGYKFTTAEWTDRYKKYPWFKPTIASQDDVKARITNENEKFNLEFAIGKRKVK
jgi:hypothetical protein